jgi:C-terminal processing protease CtpA/Prc
MKTSLIKFPKAVIFILVLISVFSFSCKKEEGKEIFPADIYEINSFIYQNTKDYYLWTSYIPANINIEDYPNPEDLFDAMLYHPLDRWSFVYNDYQEILNSLNGTEKTTGYRLQLFRIADTEGVFGIIEYVYEGSPAESAGLQRGNLILSVNGQTLNTTNYSELLNLDVMQLGLGELVADQIVDLGTSVTITKVVMTINPVLQYQLIDTLGKKIGYLVYDQFIDTFYTDLETALASLQSQGITEMVLDLRFNPGGYVTTCSKLASNLAPASAIGEVFILQQWNDLMTSVIIAQEGANSEYLITKFPPTSVNLDLSRLVVLTSEGTASASEALINGLSPYMDVITIGATTHGKYTGALPIHEDYSDVNKWLIYLVVNKIANADGNTDFVNGFTPDYPIDDNYITPLGDVTEPLLAKAIEVITGNLTRKSAVQFHEKPFDKSYRNSIEKNGIMVVDQLNLKK